MSVITERSATARQVTSFEEALEDPDSVTELVIERAGLLEVPSDIGRLRRLETLSLAGNRIRRLPETLGDLPSLKRLDLTENELEALPESLSRLTALTALLVRSNRLTALPDLSTLHALEHLALTNNPLHALPPWLAGLPALRFVELSSLPLEGFPDALLELPQLELVELWATRVLTLPPQISRWRRLRHLFLHEAGLTTLPEELGALTELRVLGLAGNRLESLPGSLAQLEKLETLDLGHNLLKDVPPILFRRLSQLHTLHLVGNPLGRVPAEISRLRRLSTLILAGTGLSELSDEVSSMFNLTALSLDDNPLQRVPPQVRSLDRLQWLSARRCGLSDVQPLRALRELGQLHLQDNALTSLGSALEGASQLRVLDVRNNALSALSGLPTGLVRLFARGNPLMEETHPAQLDAPSTAAALREVSTSAGPLPHVHSPALWRTVPALARELGEREARPSAQRLGAIRDAFERALEELVFKDSELVAALCRASSGAPLGEPVLPGRRGHAEFVALAWATWSLCLHADVEGRELVGGLLAGMKDERCGRYALYDALSLLASAPPVEVGDVPSLDRLTERALRFLALQGDARSAEATLRSPDVRAELVDALARASGSGGDVAAARYLAAVLSAHDVRRELQLLDEALAADPGCADAALRMAKTLWGTPVILEREPLGPPAEIRRLLDIAARSPLRFPFGSRDEVDVLLAALEQRGPR